MLKAKRSIKLESILFFIVQNCHQSILNLYVSHGIKKIRVFGSIAMRCCKQRSKASRFLVVYKYSRVLKCDLKVGFGKNNECKYPTNSSSYLV
jgi:hypothetical protein